MTEITFYMHIFITLFSLLNPLGLIPIFLAITTDANAIEKKAIIKKTTIAVAIILLLSAYLGSYILEFFGININSFRIAGGILLLLMAVHMLQAKNPPSKTNATEQNEAMEKEDVSIVPLAIPLAAGPGSISTVILFASNMHSVFDKTALGIVIILASITLWPILALSKPIGNSLGTTGLNVATRVMGLIIAAISVQFIIEGILAFVKING